MAYNAVDISKRYGVGGVFEGEDTELILADEIADSLSGALCFSDENSDSEAGKQGLTGETFIANTLQNKVKGIEEAKSAQQVYPKAYFEIVDAPIVKEGRSKYVAYSVCISNSTSIDSSVAMIDRRYSEFDRLNTSLKKRFPNLMEDVVFPKKMLTGNYRAETIALRSRAFEQYLSHICALEEIRNSQEFAEFFFLQDLIEAHKKIQSGQYMDALPSLQTCVHIQKKLLGENHPDVIATLCALVVACSSTNQDHLAQVFADAALQYIGSDHHSRYLVPLLQTSIRLCWKLGKDKKDLEAKLADLRNLGNDVESAPTLLELSTRRFSN